MVTTFNIDPKFKKIVDDLKANHMATREDFEYILKNYNDDSRQYLANAAQEVKEAFYKRQVYIRGIVEFSNYCKRNCLYCGIRRENHKVNRYRLTHEEILSACKKGYALGYRTFVLQSGEDPFFTDEKMTAIIKDIKKAFPDVAITLSLGEKSKESYEKFYKAGADRYLLRHETANPKLYSALHDEMIFETRKQCLLDLKDVGFQVGAGLMVGSPGQKPEDLVDDLMFLKTLEPHMVGIGPYLTHDETPLKGATNGSLIQTLVMLSLVRLILPEVLLPATTAMGTIDDYGREQAILAGCNVVMPNISPMEVRKKYELYENKICVDDEPEHCRYCIEGRVKRTGHHLNMDRGDNILWQRLN